MNHWHDADREQSPLWVQCNYEVPRYSTIKYTLDQELDLLRISHRLYPPVSYPGNYGFIPQTLDDDGDPLDVGVVMRSSQSLKPMLGAPHWRC